MKHKTPDSIKFRKLARRLGLPRYATVGLLETLWIATQVNTPRGDIGKFDNESIAIELDWQGDPDTLVNALVDTGWLDKHADPEVRLIVHDWPDHAPRYIHGVVSKNGGFVENCRPPLQSNTVVGDCTDQQPNLTKPNLTKPENAANRSPRDYPDEFEEFWKAYPPNDKGRKRGKAVTFSLWKKILKADRGEVIQAAKNYASETDEFIRDPERFVKNDWWRDWVGERERAGGLPAPQGKPKPISDSVMRMQLCKVFGMKPREVNDWPEAKVAKEYQSRILKKSPEAGRVTA